MKKNKRVFIIGNGFDLAHGLPTTFDDFRKFIYTKNTPAAIACIESFENTASKLDNYKSDAECWCDIENCLCYIFSDTFMRRQLVGIFSADEIDEEDLRFQLGQAKLLEHDYEFCGSMSDYLAEWIAEINKTQVDRLTNITPRPDDFFISFNYTDTLENVYGVPKDRILYIHGNCSNKDNLIFGHTSKCYLRYSDDDIPEELQYKEILNRAHDAMFKDVENNMHHFKDWWNKIKNADDIYVLGHSMSNIDGPYFEKIKRLARDGATWHVSYHDETGNDIDYANKLNALQGMNIKNYNMESDLGKMLKNAF